MEDNYNKVEKNVHRGIFREKQTKKYSEKEYNKRRIIEAGFGGLKRRYGTEESTT